MPPQIALFAILAYILWLMRKDVRYRNGVSSALWAVVVWMVVIGSRPVSTWFDFGGEAGSAAEAYDEGNPFERLIYFFLMAFGLYVLSRRGVRLNQVIKSNRWLFIFFLYWGLSVLWSDAPLVAFKRWIKDMGNIVMVLVVLTEQEPLEAVRAAFARCAYVLVPLSVLFIRFYSNLGRAFHTWTGEMMYTGVATHKNTLGALVMVCGLFCLWDLSERLRDKSRPSGRAGLVGYLCLMLMTLWLLYQAHSATSSGCAVLGAALFFGLRLRAVQARLGHLEWYGFGIGFMFWFLNSVVDVAHFVVVDVFGRDMNLTTRTEVWPMLLQKSDSFLLGSGFNSFWSGDRLAEIYDKLGIIQAHNGYLETFLNGGLLGVLLLIILIFSAGGNIKNELLAGTEFARVRLMFLAIGVVYNCTEAAFNKMGLIWFAFLVVIIQYPERSAAHLATGQFANPAEADDSRNPEPSSPCVA
ncbi:MAG: O-antigen ligase family protein [Verrucomicrobiia bacterium]